MPENATNIAGNDCVTYLKDFTGIADKWLSETSGLPGPIKRT